MQIYKNYSLKNHNTFGLDISCQYFAEVESEEELTQLLSIREYNKLPKLVLGAGSNILFSKDFNGLVIKQKSNESKILSEDENNVVLCAEAGVIWHQLVQFCVDKNFGGIENLALIPGTVGAAPIQNIGAYGQELKDVFHSLKGIYLDDLKEVEMFSDDCQFGYRDSVFKGELKNKFIVTEVILNLSKNPKLNTSYGTVERELAKLNKENPTIKDIADIICKIRMSKLPDPKVLGNAGSFYKNPKIQKEKFDEMKTIYPNLHGYQDSAQYYKISAGWLIEKCGFKGKRFGNIGVYEKQALVIVNYGGAKSADIIKLNNMIKTDVWEKFKIELNEEVNII